MQSAQRRWKRNSDRVQLICMWEDISLSDRYVPPDEEANEFSESEREVTAFSAEQVSSEREYAKALASIVRAGAWLQRAVADSWPEAADLAGFLAERARLNETPYEESQRERIASAYLLWPYHSARYYGYTPATIEERLESRHALCAIQALLYNNVRGCLDVLRLWFNSISDDHSRQYVSDERVRRRWRSEKLIDNIPDLCAVDFLAEHMLKLVKARAKVRKAIGRIQSLSLHPATDDDLICEDVKDAFEAIQLSQMTVFYHPNPSNVGDKEEIPLVELVHHTSGDDDPVPAKLIPFDGDSDVARNFRRLASTIYSARSSTLFPHFFKHRRATINLINDREVTKFISDGATTRYFLSSRPPSTKQSCRHNHEGGEENECLDWPIWYSKALNNIQHDENLPDWNDWDFWWRPIASDELRPLLFPGPPENGDKPDKYIHTNDHMSAYWDELAALGEFRDDVEIPLERPTGEAPFGYLMELLLRRERETRTSFFFALAQTYGENKRLCQFVGGTFLGLERPGIPFSTERFKAIAARIRGLIMAVAHYTTTYSVKKARNDDRVSRDEYRIRRNDVVSLMKGTTMSRRGRRDRRFDRRGTLLFASRPRNFSVGSDHKSSIWRPSREQIKLLFQNAEHLQDPQTGIKPDQECDMTWKALFYLGGDSEQHRTLKKFLEEGGLSKLKNPTNLSDREIACVDCFTVALEYLLGKESKTLHNNLKVKVPFYLPSRPGIRFLMALSRFVCDVQSESSKSRSNIVGLEFEPGLLSIRFNNSYLINSLKKVRDETVRGSHTPGYFLSLKKSAVYTHNDQREYGSIWRDFLNHRDFASPLDVEMDDAGQQIKLRWDDESNLSG